MWVRWGLASHPASSHSTRRSGRIYRAPGWHILIAFCRLWRMDVRFAFSINV